MSLLISLELIKKEDFKSLKKKSENYLLIIKYKKKLKDS